MELEQYSGTPCMSHNFVLVALKTEMNCNGTVIMGWGLFLLVFVKIRTQAQHNLNSSKVWHEIYFKHQPIHPHKLK